ACGGFSIKESEAEVSDIDQALNDNDFAAESDVEPDENPFDRDQEPKEQEQEQEDGGRMEGDEYEQWEEDGAEDGAEISMQQGSNGVDEQEEGEILMKLCSRWCSVVLSDSKDEQEVEMPMIARWCPITNMSGVVCTKESQVVAITQSNGKSPAAMTIQGGLNLKLMKSLQSQPTTSNWKK
ncbi:hypothetical protein FRC11_012080, partial [Ceratobasidium sp. 423]